jgi:putative membrane protein insertion efficiency factor
VHVLLRSARFRFLVPAVLLAAVFTVDVTRAADRQVSAWAALQGVYLYQKIASPGLERLGVRCRFRPTCSRYAEASLKQHGFVGGTWRTARRIARCGPWTPMGTVDEPR